MATFDPEIDRKVLPRWRAFDVTLSLGELDSSSTSRLYQKVADNFLASRIVDWRTHRTEGHAADLVGAALTVGKEALAVDAAKFLLQDAQNVSIWARELAQKILGSPSCGKSKRNFSRLLDESEQYAQIRIFRQRLRVEPRDPIMWVDLARVYAILGHREQAKKCITVAQQLASDNRFVLRSASRFWIHLDDPEKAHGLIVKSRATRSDPWILAAEIATSAASGKTSKLIRTAYRILSDPSYGVRHLSELASAVATLEMYSGNTKRARRLFTQSLRDPTENSIAQAAWAMKRDSRIIIEDRHLKRSNAFEARSRIYYANSEWKKIIEECQNWQSDQPFSSGPSISGSFISAVALEDYSRSELFANHGLIANPSNFALLNNLAFALINSGKINEAENKLSQIDDAQITKENHAVLQATRGLLAFRQNNISKGQKLYLNALSITRNAKDRRLTALASTFYAMELLNLENPSGGHIVSQALRDLREFSDPVSAILEDRIREKVAAKGMDI